MFGIGLGKVIGGFVAKNMVKSVVENVLDRNDVPINGKDVAPTAEKVTEALQETLKEQKAAIVPVKSAWKSKVVWLGICGIGMGVATWAESGFSPAARGMFIALVIREVLGIVTKVWLTDSVQVGSLPRQ